MRDKVNEGISDRIEACQQLQLCNAEILFFFKVLYLKLYIHPCLVEPSTGVCGRIEAVVRPIKDFRFRREGHIWSTSMSNRAAVQFNVFLWIEFYFVVLGRI